MSMNFSERNIRLRAVEPCDADFMYEIENDASAWRYSDTVAPLSRRILRQYALDYDADPFSARQLRLIVSVCRDDSWIPAGLVDLYEIDPVHRRAFVGIYILRDFRNMGVAGTALVILEKYASEVLNLRLLAAKVESDNHISLTLFERCGFSKVATLPEWFIHKDDSSSDMIIMTKRLNH